MASEFFLVDPSVSKLRNGAPGKLVFFQRHGQAPKNKALKPVRLEHVSKLEQLLEEDPTLAEETVGKARAVLESWREASNDPKWFDDGLNAAGTAEAAAAGSELGRFLADVGRSPDLLVTSPFRRAWQTQLIGYGAANLKGAPGCGAAAAWVAKDELSETPYGEGPCTRHSKTAIARWNPCLDVSLLAEECAVLAETNVELMWVAMCDEARRRGSAKRAKVVAQAVDEELLDNPAQAAVKERARSFATWLKAQPQRTIWVASHQGPIRRQLEALLGAKAVEERGYTKPNNAQIIAVFFPDEDLAVGNCNGKEL